MKLYQLNYLSGIDCDFEKILDLIRWRHFRLMQIKIIVVITPAPNINAVPKNAYKGLRVANVLIWAPKFCKKSNIHIWWWTLYQSGTFIPKIIKIKLHVAFESLIWPNSLNKFTYKLYFVHRIQQYSLPCYHTAHLYYMLPCFNMVSAY